MRASSSQFILWFIEFICLGRERVRSMMWSFGKVMVQPEQRGGRSVAILKECVFRRSHEGATISIPVALTSVVILKVA